MTQTYTVTVRWQHPAWNERDGFTMEVNAESKSQAIKYARMECKNNGHTGRMFFKAEAN